MPFLKFLQIYLLFYKVKVAFLGLYFSLYKLLVYYLLSFLYLNFSKKTSRMLLMMMIDLGYGMKIFKYHSNI